MSVFARASHRRSAVLSPVPPPARPPPLPTVDAFDWDAYMEQVARFAPDPPARPSWELRYDHLTGDTGALVYPAAHVYIHAALAWLTGWRPALWTTEHEPKGIVGYEARTVRPDGLLRAVQAGYLVLHVATLVAVWLFYAAVWQVRHLVVSAIVRRGRAASLFETARGAATWRRTPISRHGCTLPAGRSRG